MNTKFKYKVTCDNQSASYFRLDWALDAYRQWGEKFYIFTFVNYKPFYALLLWKGQQSKERQNDAKKPPNEAVRQYGEALPSQKYTFTLDREDHADIISKLEHTERRIEYITRLIREDIRSESA